MPIATKKRGRPNGAAINAIGLPKAKKVKMGEGAKKRPRPFKNKTVLERQRTILKMFVSEEDATRVTMGGRALSEEAVECIPANLPSALKDDNIDIMMIRRFFDNDGWASLYSSYKIRLDLPYICPPCGGDADKSPTGSPEESIFCDSCIEWFHYSCTTIY